MDVWWSNLDWFERVLWIIAIPSTLFFLIQLILSMIGLDGEVDADFSGDLDSDVDVDAGGFAFFTVRGLITFLTIFSWSGLTFYNKGWSTGTTVAISALLGVVAMFVVAGIYYFFNRMTESGTLKLSSAVGKTAEIYLPLKAKRGNMGKVQISLQGSLRELNAMTDDESDLSTGNIVQVKAIINNSILLVTKS